MSKTLESRHLVWNHTIAAGRDAFRGSVSYNMSLLFLYLDFAVYPPLVPGFLIASFKLRNLAEFVQSLGIPILASITAHCPSIWCTALFYSMFRCSTLVELSSWRIACASMAGRRQ